MAMQAYLEERKKPEEERKGLRFIADAYNIPKSTLADRVNGKQSIISFNTTKQKLTVAEEALLVQQIIISANRGCPLTHSAIASYANSVAAARHEEKVGKQWVQNFLGRHQEKLQTYWSKPLDSQRARGLNPTAVADWFNIVYKEIVEKKILPEDIFAMDESGFPPGDNGTTRVVGPKSMRIQHKQGNANRENVTAFVTICADGTKLEPLIIFKARHKMTKWFQNNVADAAFAVSENGWTDGRIALAWLKTVFNPKTEEKAAGRTRVLILDGHSSHYSLDFLNFAIEHNIVILGYPPHCTHALQGLDVVCFAIAKKNWKKALSKFEDEHFRGLGKDDFTYIFGGVFLESFTEETILKAFEVTGIHPYNPNAIKSVQMEPSKVSSTNVVFELPLPTPARRVVNFLHNLPSEPTINSPSKQGPRNTSRNGNLPSLSTKSIQELSSSLKASNSGSFLLSDNVIPSTKEIFKPVTLQPSPIPSLNWKHAKSPVTCLDSLSMGELIQKNNELISSLESAYTQLVQTQHLLEATNAQLVIQHLHAMKLKVALGEKEQRKNKDRTKIFDDGLGKVFTAGEVFDFVLKRQQAKKEKEIKLAQKASERAKKRAAKQAMEEQWKAITDKHKAAIAQWEIETQVCKDKGLPRKNWPPKPTRPKKPVLGAFLQLEENLGEEEEEEEDEDDELESIYNDYQG